MGVGGIRSICGGSKGNNPLRKLGSKKLFGPGQKKEFFGKKILNRIRNIFRDINFDLFFHTPLFSHPLNFENLQNTLISPTLPFMISYL